MSRINSSETKRAGIDSAHSVAATGVHYPGDCACRRSGRGLLFALPVIQLLMALMWSSLALAEGTAGDPAAALGGLQKLLEAPKPADPPKTAPALNPPAVEYYVALDEKQAGPFVCPKLLELAKAHQLTPETRIWRAGFTTWRRAGSDPWFDPIFAAVPPPVNGELPKLPEDKLLDATPCVDKPPPPKEKPWWKSLWPF